MITLITFMWSGWRPIYFAPHVNAFARMIRTVCAESYRIVCVTDAPKGITECETYPLWTAPIVQQTRLQNCYLRLRLFDPVFASQFGDRIVCMDLDAVILRDLGPLFTSDSYRAVQGISAPINGSMWMLQVGEHAEVWDVFQRDPAAAVARIAGARHNGKRLTGSDQAWMSLTIPKPAVWGPAQGVYQFSTLPADRRAWEHNARAVFFAGHAKPWTYECQERAPSLFRTYRSFSC